MEQNIATVSDGFKYFIVSAKFGQANIIIWVDMPLKFIFTWSPIKNKQQIVHARTGVPRHLFLERGKAIKDSAYYCYCAYVLRISRYSDFLSVMLTNSRFSHDVTTAMLVPLNKQKAAMLVPRPNPPGI